MATSTQVQETDEKMTLMENQKAQEREELVKKLKESTKAKAASRKKAGASDSTNCPRVPAKKSKMSGQDSEGEELVESFRTLSPLEMLRTLKKCVGLALERFETMTVGDVASIVIAGLEKEDQKIANLLEALWKNAMRNEVEGSGNGEGSSENDMSKVSPMDHGATPSDTVVSGRFDDCAGTGDDEAADDGEVKTETVERAGPEEHVPITALGRADPEVFVKIEPQEEEEDKQDPIVDEEGWSIDVFHVINVSAEHGATAAISMIRPILDDLKIPSSEEELKIEGRTIGTMFLKNTRHRLQFRARGNTLKELWKTTQSATYATDLHRRNLAAYGKAHLERFVYIGINFGERATVRVVFMREISLMFEEQGYSTMFDQHFVQIFKDGDIKIVNWQKLATDEFKETVAKALDKFTSRGRDVIKSLLYVATQPK